MNLSAELWVVVIGALPVSELRGAIPAGVAMGLPLYKAYGFACLGNLLPVVPLLLFLDAVSGWLRRWRFWDRFFTWFFERTSARAGWIRRLQVLGLTLFVMVPLPTTGAWTGCAAAVLFGFPFRLAFPAIAAGVLFSGLIVSAATVTGMHLFGG